MKLNSEQAKAAWVDYKEFMNLADNGGWIEQAFKFAFALGQSTQKEVKPIEVKTNIVAPKEVVEQLTLPLTRKATVATGKIKRKFNGRVKRTYKQRQNEAALVAGILKSKGQPMYLQDITKAVNSAGCNWKEQSVSGYMTDAMAHIPAIKKVGFGMYAYEG